MITMILSNSDVTQLTQTRSLMPWRSWSMGIPRLTTSSSGKWLTQMRTSTRPSSSTGRGFATITCPGSTSVLTFSKICRILKTKCALCRLDTFPRFGRSPGHGTIKAQVPGYWVPGRVQLLGSPELLMNSILSGRSFPRLEFLQENFVKPVLSITLNFPKVLFQIFYLDH